MTMEQQPARRSRAFHVIAALVAVLAVFIVVSGYFFYHRYQTSYRSEIESQLEDIAALKIRQIQEWRRERISDAQGMYLNNIVRSRIVERLKGDRSPDLEAELQVLLNNFGNKPGYRGHHLVTPDAAVDLSSFPKASPISPALKGYIRDVARRPGAGQIQFIDIHSVKPGGPIVMDALVPVMESSGGRHTLLGFILMEIDPEQYLFPIIQTWPSPSRTAETLLIRREGSNVLYLNDLRHRKGTALNLRLPLADSDLPAARALRGTSGMVEGKDYRGVDSVAVIGKVPGTPWHIVSKIDREEIYAPIREAARVIALITSLIFFTFSGVIVSYWMRWKAGQYRYQMAIESQRAVLAIRLESLMQNAGDAVLISVENREIREANMRAVEMYGYARSELMGMSLMDLCAPEARKELDHDLRLVAAQGRLMHESSHVRRDGAVFPVEISLSALEIEGARYFQSIIRDITGRKQAEAALREGREDLNRAQAVARTGSWRLDVRKNELFWSDEAYRIFGIPMGTPLTYETFLGAVHPEDREEVDLKWRAALQGEPYDLDHRIMAGSKVMWVHERAELDIDREGRLLGGFGTVQDITEKKQAEAEILKLNTELEQRVQDRTAKLEDANRELESFSYSVSHDLRAPLRAIEGFSRILQEDYGTSLDDNGKRVISVIADNGRRMSALIDDLLAFSRVGRYEMKWAPVDMEDIVRAVLGEIVPPQDAQRITFIVHPLSKAFGDPSLIRQVWTNLLSNAVKFSSGKEHPRIEVGSETRDGYVRYYVKDNGVGFDMAYAGKLFGVFQRLHSLEAFPGTGVGLAIVKSIITRHGGRIKAEASVGKGAAFSFTLPAHRPETNSNSHKN